MAWPRGSRAVFRLTGRCGPTGRLEGYGRVSKHVGKFVALPSFVPCLGTYRVVAKAYHDGILVGRDSQYVHVRP